jgi:DNA polymerase sigma
MNRGYYYNNRSIQNGNTKHEIIDISDDDELRDRPPQKFNAHDLQEVKLRPVLCPPTSLESDDEAPPLDYNQPRFAPFYVKRGNGLSALHTECLEFTRVLEPYPQEIQVRNDIVAQITHYVQERYPDATVSVFGSFASNSFLPHGYASFDCRIGNCINVLSLRCLVHYLTFLKLVALFFISIYCCHHVYFCSCIEILT